MYSKITHNIVEEHYDGAPVEYGRKLSGIYDNVLLENTPRAIELRQNSRDLFTQYDSALREYLLSQTSGDPAVIKNKIANELAPYFSRIMTGSWYFPLRAEPTITAWNTLISDILSVIEAIAAKQDRSTTVDKARSDIDKLAAAMVTTAQPSGNLVWTANGTANLLNSYLDDIIEESVARTEKNWSKDMDSAMSAYTKLVTGSENMSGLADVISLGIIQQMPSAFQVMR